MSDTLRLTSIVTEEALVRYLETVLSYVAAERRLTHDPSEDARDAYDAAYVQRQFALQVFDRAMYGDIVDQRTVDTLTEQAAALYGATWKESL